MLEVDVVALVVVVFVLIERKVIIILDALLAVF